MSLSFRAVAIALALAFTVVVSAGASAQVPSPSAAQPKAAANDGAASVENLEALAKTLQSPEQRQQLISRIETLIAAQQQGPIPTKLDSLGARVIGALTTTTGAREETLRAVPDMLAVAPGWIDGAVAAAADPETRQGLLDLAVRVAIVVFAGLAAEFIARRLLAIPRRRLEGGTRDTLAERFMPLAGRTVLDLLPLGVFAVATYGALTVVVTTRTFVIVAASWINAYVIFRSITALVRALTAPAAPSLRLLPWSDDTSSLVLIWVRRLAGVAVFGYFASATSAAACIRFPSAPWKWSPT